MHGVLTIGSITASSGFVIDNYCNIAVTGDITTSGATFTLHNSTILSCKVIGAFPGNNIIRLRNFNKARNKIASQFLCNTLLSYLPNNGKRIINLISTESRDGKSFIGKQLEEYWTSIGLNVKHLSWNEDFSKDSRVFLLAESITDLCKSIDDTDILIIEYPPLKECLTPERLINEAALNLVIAKANKTWLFQIIWSINN